MTKMTKKQFLTALNKVDKGAAVKAEAQSKTKKAKPATSGAAAAALGTCTISGGNVSGTLVSGGVTKEACCTVAKLAKATKCNWVADKD